jgi:hypothetical protein
VDSAAFESGVLRVRLEDLLEGVARVLAWLHERGYRAAHLSTQHADLETVFLTLTGRSVRNA